MKRLYLLPTLFLSTLLLADVSFATDNILCPDIEAAAQGSLLDEFYLGKAYDEGYCNIKQDKAEAEQWYRRAAEQGHTLAQYELAETFFVGDGLKTDYPEAKKWYLKAGEQGHGLSQLRLAFLYAENHFEGLTTDYAEAEKWFQKAADQNAGDARFRLGNFYNNYKDPPDLHKGFIWILKAAEGGHRVAMFDLARLFFDGKGVAKNSEMGMTWLKKSADTDVLQAQMLLAEIYKEGKYGIPKNSIDYMKWTLKIANKPTASPFYLDQAGDLFFEGWDKIPKNYPQARKFYERAALKDDPHALYRMGLIYKDGLGVAADTAKAKEYLKKSAAKGSAEAAKVLSEI